MEFTSKLREASNSLIVTVPKEIIEVLNLKKGDFCKFTIEFITSSKTNGEPSQEPPAEEDEEELSDDFNYLKRKYMVRKLPRHPDELEEELDTKKKE